MVDNDLVTEVELLKREVEDMKVITAETAFVVRTFFFIIFGWLHFPC